MATIEMTGDVVTLINVFTVDEAKQQALCDLLTEATEKVMRQQPGFVSANIHRSLDGTHVTNYAQWATEDDFRRMLQDPACKEHMAPAAQMAQSFQPVLYRVVSSHTA